MLEKSPTSRAGETNTTLRQTEEQLPKNARRVANLGGVLDAFRADPDLNVVLVRSERPAIEELSPPVQNRLSQFQGADERPKHFYNFHPSCLPGGIRSHLGATHLVSTTQDRMFFSVLDEEIRLLTILMAALSGRGGADLDLRTGINASRFHCDGAVIGIIKLQGPTTEFLDSNEATFHRTRVLTTVRTDVTPEAKLYWPNENDIAILYGIPQPLKSRFALPLPFGERPGAIHRTGQRGSEKGLTSGMLLTDLKNPHKPIRNFDVLVSAGL